MIDSGDKASFIDFVFSASGLLSRFVSDYELRHEQQEMAQKILNAYESNQILLVEAGTGIGKSWAYLVPAILWAVTQEEPIVISTHTIALQEQLLHKDIPFLLQILDIDIEVALVKGMNNYFCERKFQALQEEISHLSFVEKEQLDLLEEWASNTSDGSTSDLSFSILPTLWEKVTAERSSCSHVECPHFKKCFFFKSRKQLSEAKILIVNHHLLMADLVSKMQNQGREEKSLLPKFLRIVIDEAHHLEEIAFESFSKKTDRLDLIRWLGRLYSDHHPEKSRCYLFLRDLRQYQIENVFLQTLLQTDLPGEKRSVQQKIEDLFKKIELFCETCLKEENSGERREKKWRLKREALQMPFWQEEIKPLFLEVAEAFFKLSSLIASIRSEIRAWEKPRQELFSPHVQEMEFVAQRLTQKAEDLKEFIVKEDDLYRVKWVEMTDVMNNVILVDASLNVSDSLKEHLFDPRQSSVLCSATLASSRSFEHLKKRIGLSEEDWEIQEEIYPSPFDYEKRTLFAVPKDIPFPSEPGFLAAAAETISQAIEISRGSCFVLFTSYEMLHQVYSLVEKKGLPYPLLKQGTASRQVLIDTFKEQEGNVLFATDSFWEGVDVPGEALRCVILVKLPFKVPSDPLYQAFSEVYIKEGKDPFSAYSLPLAILKFKQGFGRLMRKKQDRGCVLCLDKRLLFKNYGVHFLGNIPSSQRVFENRSSLFAKMHAFYHSTSELLS